MRLFFALWPSDAERATLAAATRAVVAAAGGRVVPQANLHVTLAFLGSVADERVPRLRAAVAGVTAPPFTLVLDRLECFGRARVLAATPSQAPAAGEALALRLREHLLAGGFAPDPKPFRPHLTLAREVTRVSRAAGGLHMDPVALELDSFVLVESRTAHAGALYSVLQSWPLDGAQST